MPGSGGAGERSSESYSSKRRGYKDSQGRRAEESPLHEIEGASRSPRSTSPEVDSHWGDPSFRTLSQFKNPASCQAEIVSWAAARTPSPWSGRAEREGLYHPPHDSAPGRRLLRGDLLLVSVNEEGVPEGKASLGPGTLLW